MFERFTDRSRRVLVLAQNEASSLNHSFIGTEHILLALIEEGDGVAARSLGALGVRAEVVRQRIEEQVGIAESPPSRSPPFTPRAKKVLELSLREALQRNHSYIGTEHLLLGLVREGEGVAATVLTAMGIRLDQVRQKVILLMSGHTGEAGLGVVGPDEPILSHFDREPTGETGPLCPQCRGDLGQVARVQPEWIQPGSDDAVSRPLLVDVVYCGQCGTTLQMFKTNFDARQSPRGNTRKGRVAPAGRVRFRDDDAADGVRFPDNPSPSDEVDLDPNLIQVDLVHTNSQFSGLVGDNRVDVLLDVPRHVGEAHGTFAGHDFVARWQLGNNYYEHPHVSSTASGSFGEKDFALEVVVHLDPNYNVQAAEISGEFDGEQIVARLQSARGGLSPTRTVAIEGTFAGIEFSIFSTISGDLTQGLIRGQVDGHVIRLDALKNSRNKMTTVKGTFAGPPAILAISVVTLLYFI